LFGHASDDLLVYISRLFASFQEITLGVGIGPIDSALSPVVNLIGAVASLWGPTSPPPCGIQARLPPQHKTHENVYRSPLLSVAPPSAPSVPAPRSAWTGRAGKDGQTLGSFWQASGCQLPRLPSTTPKMVWLSKGDCQTWVGGVSGGDLQDWSHSSHSLERFESLISLSLILLHRTLPLPLPLSLTRAHTRPLCA